MNKIIMAAACAATVSAVSPAHAAPAWDGNLAIESFTGCVGLPVQVVAVGNFYASIFQPRNLGTNGPDSGLTLIGVINAWALKVVGDDFDGKGEFKGVVISAPNGQLGFSATANGKLKAFAVTPKNFDDTTSKLTIKGTVTNWMGNPNCEVTLRGAYTRRLP